MKDNKSLFCNNLMSYNLLYSLYYHSHSLLVFVFSDAYNFIISSNIEYACYICIYIYYTSVMTSMLEAMYKKNAHFASNHLNLTPRYLQGSRKATGRKFELTQNVQL